ncbi:MAG: hypothetical protein QW517_02960, partial [Thermofilaceae archaeon]
TYEATTLSIPSLHVTIKLAGAEAIGTSRQWSHLSAARRRSRGYARAEPPFGLGGSEPFVQKLFTSLVGTGVTE